MVDYRRFGRWGKTHLCECKTGLLKLMESENGSLENKIQMIEKVVEKKVIEKAGDKSK